MNGRVAITSTASPMLAMSMCQHHGICRRLKLLGAPGGLTESDDLNSCGVPSHDVTHGIADEHSPLRRSVDPRVVTALELVAPPLLGSRDDLSDDQAGSEEVAGDEKP